MTGETWWEKQWFFHARPQWATALENGAPTLNFPTDCGGVRKIRSVLGGDSVWIWDMKTAVLEVFLVESGGGEGRH